MSATAHPSAALHALAPLFISALALLSLSGCSSLQSPPPAPTVAPPAAWSAATTQALATPASDAANKGWAAWAGPELSELIATALRAQPDLRQAAARVAQARALAGGAQAEQQPTLALGGALRHGRDSSADPKADLARLGLQASWEPDWMGDKGLALLAAQQDAQGAALAQRALEIMLAADVAEHYGELRSLGQREALARQRQALLAARAQVESLRWAAGQVLRLQVDQAEAQAAQAQAELAELRAAQDQHRQQLALLLAQPRLSEQLRFDDPPEAALLQLPRLLPLELLERRPDVQREAAAVSAAVARIGVAKRDLYPRLSLDWAGARERLSLSGASTSSMAVVGYGVTLSLPLWDGGRIRSNIEVREAQAEEAMAAYEKAMLNALADVELAVTRLGRSSEALQALDTADAAAAAAARRSALLFEAGQLDRANLLEAQSQALFAQDQALQARSRQWSAALSARRALASSV